MSLLKKLFSKPVSVIQNLTPSPSASEFAFQPKSYGDARRQIAAADVLLHKTTETHLITLRQLLYDYHHRGYPFTFIVADKPVETYLDPKLNRVFFTVEQYNYQDFLQIIESQSVNRNQVYKFDYTHAIAKNPDVTEKWLMHFKKKYQLSDSPTVYRVTLVPGIAAISRLVFLHSFVIDDPCADLSVCDEDLGEYVFNNLNR